MQTIIYVSFSTCWISIWRRQPWWRLGQAKSHVTHPVLVKNGCHHCWRRPLWFPAGWTSWPIWLFLSCWSCVLEMENGANRNTKYCPCFFKNRKCNNVIMDSLAEMIAMMWCYFLILFSFLCMWETLISVNLLMSWRRLNKPKRRQNWLVSTSRQVFRQKIYPHSISIFHAVKIWSFGERSSQILWLFLIYDLFPSFIQSVALPFGPGHRWHWLKKQKSFNSRSWKFKLQNQMFWSVWTC